MKRKQYLISLFFSILLALLVGAGIMALTGHDPVSGYEALFKGAFGTKLGTSDWKLWNRNFANTLYKTMQLALTGIATAVASQGGIFNVGGEGQMYLGAIASAVLGAQLTGVPPVVAIPLCLLASVAAGAFYAWIPAIMKVKLKINEVITTILMNTIAITFCSYLASGPLKTTEKGISQGTASIASQLQFAKLVKGSNLTEAVFYIAVITLIVWYLMSCTTIGYEAKLTGQNRRFAFFAGLKADKLAISCMLISGAMCGMLGMFETFGLQTRFKTDFSNEFYFDGMLVAMIMQYKPLGIVLMSFFFGALKMGATNMQAVAGINDNLILIIQSIIIFFMAAENGIVTMLNNRKARRAGSNSLKGGAV